jgi:solute:Na+ symporter, SSS family
MSFNQLDYFLIGLFLSAVFYIIVKNLFSKQSSDDYFRAGGNIHWMLIGCSLIAADMSLSYVVGCSGMGFHKGIAIGSYEWTAAIAMIFVALYILPKFMALGVLTLPEYLELR